MLFSQALPHCAGGLHGFNSADLRLRKMSLKGCIFFSNGLYFSEYQALYSQCSCLSGPVGSHWHGPDQPNLQLHFSASLWTFYVTTRFPDARNSWLELVASPRPYMC